MSFNLKKSVQYFFLTCAIKDSHRTFFFSSPHRRVLFLTACLSSRSERVRFVSENFINTLQWEPAQPAVPEERLVYSVQYMM